MRRGALTSEIFVTVRVVKPFKHEGKVYRRRRTVILPSTVAQHLINGLKAERIADEA